jgi:hypothetical protein
MDEARRIAVNVAASTAVTDAAYVFFNAAASGQAATPPRTVMNSRLFVRSPRRSQLGRCQHLEC